ncbi:MAG: hypothetical protein ACE365_02840, partial [Gammaproteobacteria bacterium]
SDRWTPCCDRDDARRRTMTGWSSYPVIPSVSEESPDRWTPRCARDDASRRMMTGWSSYPVMPSVSEESPDRWRSLAALGMMLSQGWQEHFL